MYATLFQRLCAHGFCNVTIIQQDSITTDAKVCRPPRHSLKLAYVEEPSDAPGARPYKPLIPYLINLLIDEIRQSAALYLFGGYLQDIRQK